MSTDEILNIIAWGAARKARVLARKGEPRPKVHKGRKNHGVGKRISFLMKRKASKQKYKRP